jgi:glycosyltransferase involved in cell wall biosynthesis
MLISLIICTRNRVASLRTCLSYVRQLQSPGDWELIVVDNGSSDGTLELLKEYGTTAPFPVVIIHEAVPGLGRARNAGLARATGPIIAFTDDDCYVSADFLKETVRAFEDENIAFIGGRVLLHDPSDAPLTIRPELEPYRLAPHGYIRPGQLIGANMAFRRTLLAAIGPFDPAFGAGSLFRSCEETDLQTRASASGATGAYNPGPVVWHHHGRKPGPDCDALNRGYDYGRGAYLAKFILDSRTRPLFLKNWYWWTLSNLRDRQFGRVRREFSGALRYILYRMSGKREEMIALSRQALNRNGA